MLFGLGVGAILAVIAIIIGISVPMLAPYLDGVSYRARTYYRKLMPHPQYLPTPAPVVSAGEGQGEREEVELTFPPAARPEDVGGTPAVTSAGDALVLATATPVLDSLPAPGPGVKITLPEVEQWQLSGISHQWQTWNNCGPATVTMYTSYFAYPQDQAEAAQFLKPNRDDKNVSPTELAAYARRTTGLEALVRRGGSIELLKTFLVNKLPILTETWLVHEGDGLGHYRLVTGYDDKTGQFTTYDSLNGANYKVSYEQFEADWRVFNHLYVVLYPPEQAEVVFNIIGPDMNNTVMYERILAQAQAQIEANPNDVVAHFNRGEALALLGRAPEATAAFDRARQLGLHWRRLWYQFTPFEAYYAVGRYQDVLTLAEATLKSTGGLEEVYYYHGLALQATGQPGAEDDFRAALKYNPHFTPAEEALNTLSN